MNDFIQFSASPAAGVAIEEFALYVAAPLVVVVWCVVLGLARLRVLRQARRLRALRARGADALRAPQAVSPVRHLRPTNIRVGHRTVTDDVTIDHLANLAECSKAVRRGPVH